MAAIVGMRTVAERCRRLDAAAIRTNTEFHWWPKPKRPN